MENHQVWSPPSEHIWMRIAVRGTRGTPNNARAKALLILC